MTNHITDGNQYDWRIDSEVKSTSNWWLVVYSTWLSILFIVMSLSQLSFWQWLVIISTLLFISGWWYKQQSSAIRHITQPLQKQGSRSFWFLYQKDKRDKDKLNLLQGYLLSSYANRYLIVLHFRIFEPFSSSITIVIWRDQVVKDDWRKLQSLSRLGFKSTF